MVDSKAAVPSTEDDVRAVAEPHGLGAREIAALTAFVDRVQTDQGSRVMPKWRIHAAERLAQSLDALELEQVRRAKDAADIGSGAGFPGLALAAALPDARFTLIEQDGRRCRFLRQSVEAMALANVDVVQAAVQLWTAGESQFDLVTARGLWHAPAMFHLAAPLLKNGGALVLWTHDPEKDGVEDEVRSAALRLSLSPVAILGEGGLCLNAYTKMESPSAAASASVQPPERLSRSRSLQPSSRSRSRNQKRERGADTGLPKLERNMSECEARITKVSARIDELKQTGTGASKPQLAQLDSRIQLLEAQRVALAEQLDLQRSLLSAREQKRARLLTAYEREDGLGTNEEARRLMAEHPPALDDLQSELVARLRTDGIAEIEFARLFSADLWKDVTEEATTFGRETERRLTERSSPQKTTPKELAHRRYDKDAELPLDDPWLRIAVSSRLLDVVDAYLGMWGKLTHCNQVYKAAPPEDTESWENWHRDAQDKRLVRVVLHFSDVQAGTDQLEYVPGSTGDGPYAALWPWAPGGRRVAPATEFAELVPDSAIRTLSPRAGTIVLWNASGLHREGATARGPQILWKCSYSSPASFTKRKFRVQLPEPCDLSEAARFAVS
jgi:16S rRNA (guanine527-N7)-methyltransferase